jgi:hypothetical protein
MAKKGGRARRRQKRVPRVPRKMLRTADLKARMDELVKLLNERAEFIDALRRDLDAVRHDTDLQFKRTAQVQADIDLVKRTWEKSKLL